MSYKDFESNLKKLNQPHPTNYLILGPELYLIDLYHQIILNKYKDYPIEKYVGFEDYLISSFNDNDLFSAKKIIQIKNFESFKDEKKLFKKYCENPNPAIILILIAETKKGITEFLSKHEKITYLNCATFKTYGEDVESFIQRLCNVRKFTIEKTAKEHLKQCCGPDLYRISQELQKLFLLKLTEKSITFEDTSKTVIRSAETSVFEIVELISRKKLFEALQKTMELFEEDEQSAMLFTAALMNYFEKLLISKDLVEQKISKETIAKEIGCPSFFIDRQYLQPADKFSFDQLRYIFSQLVQVDLKLKSTSLTPKSIIDSLVIHLCK